MSQPEAVTELLSKIDQGDAGAAEQLLPLVYEQLRQLAGRKLAQETPGQTLQPTGLVHEAYLRLVGADQSVGWNSRGHFFSAAAEAMRRILVDQARRKKSQKRGGDRQRVELPEAQVAEEMESNKLLALEDALIQLEEEHPKQARLVKLRFFAGLTIEKAASVLDISTTTADRYWTFARAWLQREVNSHDEKAGRS